MNNRFEISTEGMRQLHEGRPLWHMVKELVSNAWDEDITTCDAVVEVKQNAGSGERTVHITVTDDGKGFTDIADAYTLMAPTPKRGIAGVRGRFNIGEKELISIADTATVETVGQTVHFPLEGGKVITKNKRKSGTKVTVTVNEGKSGEVADTFNALVSFIPPEGVKYTVSDGFKVHEVPQRTPIVRTTASLQTVLAGKAYRPIYLAARKTSINIFPPSEEQGRIFELGIPIQTHGAPFDIDICQKVPLPPNRDVVPTAYLQDVYAEVLKVTTDYLTEDNASETWVKTALEDSRTTDDTVKKVMEKRVGSHAILWTPNLQANEAANSMGRDIIMPNMLSKVERERFKKAGLETTTIFRLDLDLDMGGLLEPTPAMLEVEEYAQWLGQQLLGIRINARFIDSKAPIEACYSGGQISFNIHNLKKRWFQNAPTEGQTSLILHELAHENHGTRSHGDEFIRTLSDLSAKAISLAQTSQWWSRPNSKKEEANA